MGAGSQYQPLFDSNGDLIGFETSSGKQTLFAGIVQNILGQLQTSGQLAMMVGDLSGTAPAAGVVGEVRSAQLLVASAVSLSTGVAADVLTLALPAGHWEVTGVVAYHSATGTTVPNDVKNGIGTAANTIGAQGTYSYDYIAVAITDDPYYVTPPVRFDVGAAGATAHLVSLADFTVSTLVAYGNIRAVRVA